MAVQRVQPWRRWMCMRTAEACALEMAATNICLSLPPATCEDTDRMHGEQTYHADGVPAVAVEAVHGQYVAADDVLVLVLGLVSSEEEVSMEWVAVGASSAKVLYAVCQQRNS